MAVNDSAGVVNEALMLIGGNQPQVAGNFPTFTGATGAAATAAAAANVLYGPCIAAVMRQFEWDFSRFTAPLVLSGNVAPGGWPFEYLFPADAIEVWQILPVTQTDLNDPLPYNFIIANNVVTAVSGNTYQTRVIHTDLDHAAAVYSNGPSVPTWDATFRAAVVRLLASELAMAIAGKPDTMGELLDQSGQFEKAGETRQN